MKQSSPAISLNAPGWDVEGRPARAYVGLCTVQGFYCLATGVWPLVDIDSFQALTGAKTDHWLVKTVGVLVTAIALVLLLAAVRGRPSPEVILLAVAAAIGLAAIDVVYVSLGVIAPIYLADALIEVLLIAAWVWVMVRISSHAPGEGRA